jgi:hypothetical protein
MAWLTWLSVAMGASIAGLGSYAAYMESLKATSFQITIQGFLLYFLSSQLLSLGLEALKWLGLLYKLCPTLPGGYTTVAAVDAFFATRPFIVPHYADLVQKELQKANKQPAPEHEISVKSTHGPDQDVGRPDAVRRPVDASAAPHGQRLPKGLGRQRGRDTSAVVVFIPSGLSGPH